MERALVILILVLLAFGLVALLTEGQPADLTVVPAPDAAPDPAPGGGGLKGRERDIVPEADAPIMPRGLSKAGEARFKAHAERVRRYKANQITLTGIVLDAEGHAVEGARVYQLTADGSARGKRWPQTPQTKTGADGRFVLLAQRPLADTQVLAMREPGAVAFADGADLVAGATLRLVLPAPTELDVFLVGADRQPLAGEGIQVVPLTGRGPAPRFPPANCPLPEQYGVTDALGRAHFRFPRSVPVVVTPVLEGFVANPLERWLPDSIGTVSFAAQKGVTFVIEAQDAASGKALGERLWATVFDPQSGLEVAGGAGDAEHALRLEAPLLPGRYDILVTMRGREPTLVPGVRVPAAGAEVKVSARMAPLGKPGTLTLELSHPTQTERTRAGNRAPAILLKRLDGPWAARGWVRRNDAKTIGGWDTLTLNVRPGRYALVVTASHTGTVGHVAGVEVGPGQTTTQRVTTRAGILVPLNKIVPPEIRVRGIRVEVPGIGYLPAMGHDTRTQGTIRVLGEVGRLMDAPGSAARLGQQGGLLLGPYPGRTVILHITDWKGDTHRIPVR